MARTAGLDSLGASEFRNALAAASGLDLPATLVFDFASVDAVVEHLLDKTQVTAHSQMTESDPATLARIEPPAPTGRLVGPFEVLAVSSRSPMTTASPSGLVSADREGLGHVTLERWDVNTLDLGAAESSARAPAARFGSFVAGGEEWDATAFGVAPAEAALMDPAQRLLLAGARGALVDGRGDGPAGKAEVTPISRVLGLDRVFRVL
eukprot:1189350-Prorocentrum_minimum.AAC.3